MQEELSGVWKLHKLMPRPYIVIIGPTLKDIKSVYVIVGECRFKVDSIVLGVELCFQCIKIFFKGSPVASNHIWEFIEQEVYKRKVEGIYKPVISLIEQLNRF